MVCNRMLKYNIINPEDGNCNDDQNGKPPAHYAAHY
jgi:hypothetical protein